MPDPATDIYMSAAAEVLQKEPGDVTSEERHRFKVAFFTAMDRYTDRDFGRTSVAEILAKKLRALEID